MIILYPFVVVVLVGGVYRLSVRKSQTGSTLEMPVLRDENPTGWEVV